MRRAATLLLIAAALAAQEAAPDAAAERASEAPPRHEVRLRSGTMLIGLLEPAEWKVLTAFGALKVPVSEVRSVRFGRASDPERLDRVRGWIADLASANPEKRSYARAALTREGPFAALDLQREAQAAQDPEVKRVCAELLDELEIDEEDFIPDEDHVVTERFTISGRVEPSSFKVTVAELGALNVRRKDIVSVREAGSGRELRLTLSAQNAHPDGWVDSGLRLERGESFRLSATGAIHFPNWGNQIVSPEGNVQLGHSNGIAFGTLVARIGPEGAFFRVGQSYAGAVTRSGTVQLCIVLHPNMRNQPCSGVYEVRLQRDE